MTEGWREFRLMRMAIDPEVREVLRVTSSTPLTVSAIAGKIGMGESKVYRLVHKMSVHGMLRRASSKELRSALYRSNVRAIDIQLGHEGLGVIVEYSDGCVVTKRMSQIDCLN